MVAREKPCIEISVMSHIFPHQWEQPLLGTITYIIESFNIQVHVSVIFICLLYIKLSQWEGKDNSQPPTFSQFLIKQTITSIKLTKRFSASSKIFLGIHKKRKKKNPPWILPMSRFLCNKIHFSMKLLVKLVGDLLFQSKAYA